MWSRAASTVTLISKWTFLVVLILFAILSLGSRTVLNYVDYFKAEIEQELSDYGVTGVAFDNIRGSWKGVHPLLKIKGASLSIPGRSQALSINELELSVNLIQSLLTADLKLDALHAHAQKLILVHDRQGQWLLNDIPFTSEDADDDGEVDIYALFKRLPDFVNIDIQLTQIRDQLNGVDYLIQDSRLRSSRRGDLLTMTFEMHLPSTLGQNFEFSLKGDGAHQQAYISARNLNLAPLLGLAGKHIDNIGDARMSIQSWAALEGFRLSELINKIRVSGLVLNQESDSAAPVTLGFKQKIEHDSGNWRIHTLVDDLRKANRSYTGFETQLFIHRDSNNPSVWISGFQLADMQELLIGGMKDANLVEIIQGMSPDASLQDIVAELDLEQFQHSTLRVDFSALTSKAFNSIPGVSEMNGRLLADGGNAQIQIHQSPVTADFDALLREPVYFDEFATTLNMTWLESDLLLEAESLTLSNADISVQARAWMEAGPEKRPFLSLRASYQDGNAASTGKYLPVSIMWEDTVAWLDTNIKGGRIAEGGLMFHGRLQKISELEKNQAGEFHALFRLQEPDVSFLPEWPPAQKGHGEVSFHNLAMNISFDDVQFATSIIDHVNISIPDLTHSLLIIEGNTTQSAGVVLDTLETLPILEVADLINRRKQRIGGEVDTRLALRIPLYTMADEKLSIKATAALKDVELSIPEWMIDFKSVNGTLNVENERVSAPDLRGLYYGDSASLVITPNAKSGRTVFNLRGDLASRNLATLLPPYLQKPVKGKSPWDIQVSVANRPSARNVPVRIHAKSTLSGTELGFPQPFNVARKDAQQFNFDATISTANELDFKAAFVDHIYASGQVKPVSEKEVKLSGLQVSFGTDQNMDRSPGVQLAGHIKYLNLNEWAAYREQYFDGDVDDSSLLKQLQQVDVTIDESIWASQRIKESKVKLENNGSFIDGSIDSSLAGGSVRIPFQIDNENPFTADLDYIRLQKTELENNITPDITDMPNLLINSKKVSYESMEFSALTLHTQNSDEAFDVKQLDFSRDEVSLKSSGHWQYNDETDDHVSVFNINIEGEKFGQTLSALGLGETIRNGEIQFDGQIGWSGSLYDINWPTLIGEVQLKLEDGYLRNVDPGAGRFVGLLSLNALPKRLFLDFGDVLNEGMQFDVIQGQFSIKGETMTTTNASMEGSSATVRLSGSTNLRDKTYDQSMIIVPRVGDTLPVLGALAAGNAVGWGVLLLQRIFKDPIDKSVEIKYSVSGSWEDPEIKLISAPEPVKNLENNVPNDDS